MLVPVGVQVTLGGLWPCATLLAGASAAATPALLLASQFRAREALDESSYNRYRYAMAATLSATPTVLPVSPEQRTIVALARTVFRPMHQMEQPIKPFDLTPTH